MIRLLYFTDIHYSRVSPEGRLDTYPEDITEKLDQIVSISKKVKSDAVLFGGDIWHRKHDVIMSEVREMTAIFKMFNTPVYGILGNHDQSGYRADSKNNRAAGVLEAAEAIQWIDEWHPYDLGEGVYLSGTPYKKDYEALESYGVGYKRPQTASILIWLSHGILTQKEKLPYESTNCKDVLKSTNADIILNGHIHSEVFTVEEDGKLIISPGSIGRVARNERHTPSVVVIVVDTKKKVFKSKIIKLSNAKPAAKIFLDVKESDKESDDDIRTFVETLKRDSEDLRDEDLKSVVAVACKGKPIEVHDAVLGRLGI